MTTGTNAYTANWYTKTEAGAEFKAQTMSDMGPIVTYFKFIATTGIVNSSGNANIPRTATLDKGWVQIGPLLFGYAELIFDVAYGAQTYGGDNIGDFDGRPGHVGLFDGHVGHHGVPRRSAGALAEHGDRRHAGHPCGDHGQHGCLQLEGGGCGDRPDQGYGLGRDGQRLV